MQILPALLTQETIKVANDMKVESMGLTEIIQKDDSFEMYRDIIDIFQGDRAQDAIDTMNLFYRHMVDTIQKEAQKKNVGELGIEVL